MHKKEGGSVKMKGYYVNDGYMGYINGKYMLFADESDYIEYFEDNF